MKLLIDEAEKVEEVMHGAADVIYRKSIRNVSGRVKAVRVKRDGGAGQFFRG